MQTTYAVTWSNGCREPATGKLELGPDALRFDGRRRDQLVCEEIPYGELGAVTIGRREADRIEGRQTLVVERPGGGWLRIAGVGKPWIVSELAERLTAVVLRFARFRATAF
jgi:hypothetical protein